MAYNFPNSPSNGDTVVVNGVTYEYNSTDNAWKTGTGLGPAITSDGSTPSLASGITAAEIRTLIGSPDLSSVDTDIIPDGDGTRDLGSSTAKWKDLYLSGNTLFLGPHSITADSSAILFPEIKIGTGSNQVTLSGGAGGTLQTGGTSIFSGAFADLSGKPTTIAGYGITDGATQSYVTTQINNVIDSAPGALDTLNELAAALGDDANFSTTVTNNLALKAPLASPSFTGTPTAPTATTGNNTTQIATTAFVQSAVSGAGSYNDASVDTHLNRSTAATGEVLSWNGSDYDWVARTTFSTLSGKPTTLSGYGITDGATIDSPAFTGTPTAPTASGGTNSTQIATTAYVQGEISSFSGGDSQRDYTASGSITDKNAVVLNSNGTVSNVSVINAGFNTSTRPRVSSTGTNTNLHAGSDWNSTDSVFHTAYRDSTTLYIRAMSPSFSGLTLSTVTTTTTSLGGTADSTIIYKHIEGTSTGILFYNSSGWKAKYITYDNSIPTHNIGTNTFSLAGEPYDVVIKDSGRMFILYSGSVASVAIDASSKTFTLTDTASSTLTVGSGTFHAFRLFWDTIQSKIILFKSASNSNSYQYISESSGSLTASTAGSGNTTTFQQIEYHPGLSTYFGIRYTVLQGPPIDKIEPKFTPLTAGASSVTYGSEVTTGITIDKYDSYNQFTQHGEIRFLPSLTGNGVSIFSLATVGNSQYGDQDYGKERFAFGTLTSSATYTDNGSGFAKLYSGTTQNSEWYAHDFSMVTKVDGYAYVTYPISSGGQIGTTLVRTASVSNANEYLGIAQNAASNGGSVTVMLAGGISTGHSSLTQDVKYYVQNDGTIATTSSSTVAGHSVSTDSIQVADSQGIFASSTAFADLTSTPTTLSGYGITDAISSAGDVDIGSSDFITTGKSYYANMFATTGDLPSATTYHGMFAHVHGTGAGYFAHAGNWVELANKSYVDTEVANIVNSAPATLDTLDELAAALNDDANFATTVTTSLGLKAPLASPALTGTPTAPTATSGTNTTQIATTEFVQSAVSGLGGGGGASVTTSDSAPSSPSAGDLWYNTDAGGLFLYYTDADSSQWVEVVGKTGPAGATGAAGTAAISRYANVAGFPASPTAADLAYANDTNTVYVYNGTAWEVVSSGNDETPVILTEPPTTTQSLNADGTTSTVTMTAEDPEGFDITYGIAYKTAGNALPDQLASATTIDQSTGVYTFTPSTTTSDAGSFTARLSASDGARITTRTVDFSLIFSTPITFSSAEPGISTDLSNSIVYSTTTNTGGSGMAQSATLRTGKYYFEIDISSISSNIFIGIADESVTDPGWNISNQVSVYSANGSYYPGGSNTGGISYYLANDVLMIAYDTTTREFWIGKNGTWGLDPASDAGKSIGGTGGFTLTIGSGTTQSENITASIILVSADLNYTIPTGFSTH